ncbi:hypothetical protein [Halorussus salinisoli]|uniref:hypothetical protein n=1 Tax=Halorussus salinisoli TaxID=2558242 RepID=UPI0010C1F78E|nr:hypothetical protein [Halorussus salinisoli]
MSRPLVAVPTRTYRLLDYATKLGGLGLVAVGLEVGGATLPGLALGACGAALGVSTVFIETTNE